MKQIISDGVECVSRGTRRITTLSGFINVMILLSLWSDKLREIGIPTTPLYGGSIMIYLIIIIIIGYIDRHVEEKKNGNTPKVI